MLEEAAVSIQVSLRPLDKLQGLRFNNEYNGTVAVTVGGGRIKYSIHVLGDCKQVIFS